MPDITIPENTVAALLIAIETGNRVALAAVGADIRKICENQENAKKWAVPQGRADREAAEAGPEEEAAA